MRKKLFTLLLAVATSLGTLFAESGTCGDNLTWDLANGVLTISGTGEMTDYSSLQTDLSPWHSFRTTISSLVINEGVTSIGSYAFSSCGNLTSVTIPNSVISIGWSAFSSCTSLTSVAISNNVTSIEDYAFHHVPNIVYSGSATGSPWGARSVNGFVDGYWVYSDESKSQLLACSSKAVGAIIIPNTVTSIGNDAFYGCSSMTSVMIPNSVTSIGMGAFTGCSGLNKVNITDIATWCNIVFAFAGGADRSNPLYYAKHLYVNDIEVTNLIIPNSVSSIGSNAFCNCIGLTSVTIPNSVTNIGYYAFQGCSGLTAISIGSSVTSIKGGAFEDCSGLTSVTIPNSVTNIEFGAFRNCSSLTSVTIPNSVTSIGNYAFSGCNKLPVTDNIRYADTYLVEAVDKTLTSYTIQEGTRWINGGSSLLLNGGAFDHCSNLVSIEIPSSVVYIGDYAFGSCNSLKSVTLNSNAIVSNVYSYDSNIEDIFGSQVTEYIIGESVTSIGKYAFRGCSRLTSVTIPNSITTIGDEAFSGCSSLTSIVIPSGVTNIGGSNTFYGCNNLTSVIWNVKNYADFSFYGESPFSNSDTRSHITSFVFGDEVEHIPAYLCYGMSSLTSIIIPSSVKSIGQYSFQNCSSLQTIYAMPSTPPSISSYTFKDGYQNAIVYVPLGCYPIYKATRVWEDMNIQRPYNINLVTTTSSVTITFEELAVQIASCGVEGGEQQPGNILEYIGLEPNSEYKDMPIVLTATTGETDTVNVSFTTTALELTTKPSKPVSSTTAILLAETNMSDAEENCGFEYKRNDAPADMSGTKVFCPVANGQMAGRLKNLKDDVYYKYRAFYQSQAGNMYYGDWQYIFTGDVAVEFDPILYTYGATVVQESEATISGYALAGSEDFTEQGFEYWAESRANSGANAPLHMAAAIGEHKFVQASGIKMSVTLTDLDEGTVYKYRAYGKVGDQYYYGADQTFTTQGEWHEGQGFEEILSDKMPTTKAHKILYNGQIFILRGEKVYTLQGQKVR